jgi:hypothetical protein
MKEMINAYKNLAEDYEGKRPVGRHRYRWDSHTKTILINK